MEAQADQKSKNCCKDDSKTRLSKRLAYLLRYGAIKEGLSVDDNGYVEVNDLCNAHLLRNHSPAEVLKTVQASFSNRQTKRYECRESNGKTYVRAAYLRNFERSPFHAHTKVKTLFEWSINCILNNLEDYDLENFPDEHILRLMIRRLKREKRLTNKALSVLLAPTVTHLDLEGVYLTKNTLRMVWTQCPHLTAVSLKDCGYIITDNVLAQFTKNLPKLERLNLCYCSHLTNKMFASLAKNLPHLHTLHMAKVKPVTYKGVLDFLHRAPALKYLDVYYLRVSHEEKKLLVEAAKAKEIMLLLRGPRGSAGVEQGDEDEDEADDDSEKCIETPPDSEEEAEQGDEEDSNEDENEDESGDENDDDGDRNNIDWNEEAAYAALFDW